MSRSIGMKTIALLLAAVALVALAGSGVAVAVLASEGLYSQSLDQMREAHMESDANSVAAEAVYAYVQKTLSQGPAEYLNSLTDETWHVDPYGWYLMDSGYARCAIYDGSGKLLSSTFTGIDEEGTVAYTVHATTEYRIAYAVDGTVPMEILLEQEGRFYTDDGAGNDALSTNDPANANAPTVAPEVPDTVPDTTTSAMEVKAAPAAGETPPEGWNYHQYVEEGSGYYSVYYYDSPTYTVSVYLSPGAWPRYNTASWQVLSVCYAQRYSLIWLLAGSLVALLGTLIYLGWAAGRRKAKPGEAEIAPVFLNRAPLDVYLLVCGGGAVGLGAATLEALREALSGSAIHGGFALLGVAAALGCALLALAFYCALAAQVKLKGGYWWRHTAIGWCVRKLGGLLGKFGRFCRRLYGMLPVIWQWLLVGAGMVAALGIGMLLSLEYSGFFLFLAVALCLGIIVYGGYAFGVVYSGARRMAKGDLNQKVPTRHLHGRFRDMAEQLNDLSDVAVVAARNQLKSERMRTELITNVSHDIKTPLTSIINYVDLLCRPHTPEEEQQYLDVLARQSQRMKKLIEDLVEMSKASSGNVTAEITRLDAAEAVNQALGEFADKLAAVSVTPVFPQLEEPVYLLADGRLLWRVLSNLLSNAVKYALPGTRLYVDLAKAEGSVVISLKNISREQLNISADELMERFVRGDASRNTEGSGLGLNIAQSLMEIQHGRLQLLVDGDLFKITLIFPAAPEE